jgi:hypothetical protein
MMPSKEPLVKNTTTRGRSRTGVVAVLATSF